jgi:DUF4097 and DUF4098 domain-containing protein YvlB
MRIRSRWELSILVAAAVLTLAAISAQPALADSRGHFERTLTVTGPVDLDVQTGSGDITVQPGDSSQVEIHALIKASGWHIGGDIDARIKQIEDNPPIQQEGNTIRIGRSDSHDLFKNISISYEIKTPKETHLHAKSGSGDEQLEGIAGPVEAESGSGSLRLRDIGAEVRASTGSGDVEIQNAQGKAHISSGSGTIRATGIAGALSVSTGSGDVKLEQTAAGDVEVSTGSGEVELNHVKGAVRVSTGSGNIRADGEPAGPWRLHTGSGDVSVKLPESASFELAAHTSSGSIQSNRQIMVSGNINPHELRGKVGNGGVLVDLNTSSGSIRID